MWIWLRANAAMLPDTHWVIRAFEEFDRMFGRAPGEGLSITPYSGIGQDFKKALFAEVERVIVHYGEGLINESTMACIIAEAEKNIVALAQAQQVLSPDARDNSPPEDGSAAGRG